MSYKKFTAAEKAAYKKGKIIGYYAARKKCCSKLAPKQKQRYSDFDPNEALARALQRSSERR